MSIKLRITLIVVIPVLLALIISGAFSAYTSLESANEAMKRQSDIVNAAYSQALTQAIESCSKEVEAIAREAGFFDPLTSEQEKIGLFLRHASTTELTNLGIFGIDGKNIFVAYDDGSTIPVGVADISARPYLPEALSGKTVIFGPSVDVVTGRMTITIATRSLAPGAPASIITSDFDLNFVEDMVDKARFGSTGYTFLIDGEGMILAHPERNLIGRDYKDLAKEDERYAGLKTGLDKALQTPDSGNISFEYNEENFAAFQRVENTDGWLLVSTAFVSEYMESYNQSVKTLLVVIIGFLVATILIAFYIGHRMASPIRFASSRAIALSHGDLTQVSNKKAARSKDEIGALVRSLDSAVEALNLYVRDISKTLGEIASGNLDVEINVEYQGDFAPIKSSMQQIASSLNTIMMEIRSAAARVNSGSAQIAQASNSLASGSTHQADTILEFSSTVDQVSQMASQNAQTSLDALTENQKAESLMGECMNYMQQMVDAIRTINNSSTDISRVIKVIDDIAFQTNILALNAAVEAARAGQHGKGFSVVAEEVRSLAAKSANAAKETSALIEKSIHNASAGAGIVAHVDESLHAIVDISKRNASQISKINESSGQQSDTIKHVASGITQLSTIVQSNSATAVETATSSAEMSSQAAMLNQVVARFRVKEQLKGPSYMGANANEEEKNSNIPLGLSSKY